MKRSGAVYVYKRTGNNWTQEAYIKPPMNNTYYYVWTREDDAYDGTSTGEKFILHYLDFGHSVAIDGDTLVVGIPGDPTSNTASTTIVNGSIPSGSYSSGGADIRGSVAVYKRSGNNWAAEAYLLPKFSEKPYYKFGYNVDISGDTIAVAPYRDDCPLNTISNNISSDPCSASRSDVTKADSGAIWTFKRSGNNWSNESFIKPANIRTGLSFGKYDLSLEDDTLAVCARRDASSQNYISNTSTVVANTSMSIAGALYVYKRSSNNWTQEAFIKPTNPKTSGWFCSFSSISGDTLIASNCTTTNDFPIFGKDNDTTSDNEACVFERDGSSWSQNSYIATESVYGPEYVSIDNNTIVLGSRGENSNQRGITNGTSSSSDTSRTGSGAVFVYQR